MKNLIIGLCVLAGCGDDSPASPIDAGVDATEPDAGPLSPADLVEAAKLSPLPSVPADPTNAVADNAKAATLGQMLFFDKSYAGALAIGDDGTNGGLGAVGNTGKVSCASCHAAGSDAMDDRRTKPNNVSLGTGYGTRNALGLVNASFYKWTNWAGRFDSQWSLPLAVAESPVLMNSTRLEVAHMLYAKYRTEYNATFATPLDPALDPTAIDAARFPPAGKPGQPAFDNMAAADKDIINAIYANYGKALAAYMRKLVSRHAPFDQFVAGDTRAISLAAQRGFKIFLASCVSCHSGPNFADDSFHTLGVPQTGPRVPATDNGRFQDVPPLLASAFNTNGNFSDDKTTGKLTGLAQDVAQTGQFRTKSLRNLSLSGPFMHSGQFVSLDEVVAFYNAGGGTPPAGGTKDPKMVPLSLSMQAQTDLVAFMRTLSGELVPVELLVDTSK
jgi:cytochrome c peroxidase